MGYALFRVKHLFKIVSFQLILPVLLTISIFMDHFQQVVSHLHDMLPRLAGSHIIHTPLSENLVFFNTFLHLKTKNQWRQ